MGGGAKGGISNIWESPVNGFWHKMEVQSVGEKGEYWHLLCLYQSIDFHTFHGQPIYLFMICTTSSRRGLPSTYFISCTVVNQLRLHTASPEMTCPPNPLSSSFSAASSASTSAAFPFAAT